MPRDRVFFYSRHDGACYSEMIKAKKILQSFSVDKDYNVNDIIELYQVKLYIDNEIYLQEWTEHELEQIKNKVKDIWALIIEFWNRINNSNLIDTFNQLECWTLQDSFWEITSILSTYKNFNKPTFAELLNSKDFNIRAVLAQQKLVKCFGSEIRIYLLSYNKTAELLLSQYVEKHDRDKKELYFPKNLSLADKEDIISRYIDYKDVNLNFVRLVLNIRKQPELDISDKTRLKAQKLEDKLNRELLDKNGGVAFGLSVGFSESLEEPAKITKEGTTYVYEYSTKLILQSDTPFKLLTFFNSLFCYLDEQQCISLVSKNSDFCTTEKVFMSSKNEYPTSWVFGRKENLSLMQILAYDDLLQKKQNSNIEEIIEYYIVEHLNKLGLKGFRFKLPSKGTTYFEKIRTLLAEYDALLKQYKLFKEDGEIDFDLLRMSSRSYSLSQIPSFISKKYFYLNEDKLSLPLYLLFSDQSGLIYLETFKRCKHSCLYDLLDKEEVLYGDYLPHQRDRLHHLFEQGYLFVDHNGYIRGKDVNQLFILKQLYTEEVLSYWHYDKECRGIIEQMAHDGILYSESTLFNKLEQSYFNYYLNKKEFTNGLDIRNSFMHGTNPDSENTLVNLYYILLKLIVLTVLKIHDDQYLKFKIKAQKHVVKTEYKH
ncbi:hypothetical protein SLH46_11115 [Draconibacterium sp. IB214405]|uniref:hypothetical protein n=1 Tax=Draconibacterium sp. IB214405 TaxID=3097352 RepID=UPI002A140BEB|nr:hypothetical protein [Draconibacterium sp. IB214405]MDX8339736.1 hypothetical protein [Draconibacterium sp. IB214405]